MLLTIGIAVVFCFVLGLFFEKWHSGNIRNWWRLFGWGILILVVKGAIAFDGYLLIFN